MISVLEAHLPHTQLTGRLCRDGWKEEIGRPTRFVVAYIDRLDKLCHEKDGAGIMAHAYTQHGATLIKAHAQAGPQTWLLFAF